MPMGEWPLVFDGKTYKTLRARALFDAHHPRHVRLCRARCHLHRPHQRPEQPRFLRGRSTPPTPAASSRCRLTAPACSAPSTWPGWWRSPFTPDAHLDQEEFASLVTVAIRMLDNTIEASGFPLEQQRQEAFAKRRIGLGMTGLADALMMVGLRYGSPEAAERAGE